MRIYQITLRDYIYQILLNDDVEKKKKIKTMSLIKPF